MPVDARHEGAELLEERAIRAAAYFLLPGGRGRRRRACGFASGAGRWECKRLGRGLLRIACRGGGTFRAALRAPDPFRNGGVKIRLRLGDACRCFPEAAKHGVGINNPHAAPSRVSALAAL